MIKSPLIYLAISTFLLGAPATARDQVRIVGSSTVFPFSISVAETFGKSTDFKTSFLESTGSGGGLKLFCIGSTDANPDITNAPRRIKASEIARCAAAGITDSLEVKIGYDGTVSTNLQASDVLEISLRDVYLALAKNVPDGNGALQAKPYTKWAISTPTCPASKSKSWVRRQHPAPSLN